MAYNAARIQLGAASRCNTLSENKPTPPPDARKERGSYKKPRETYRSSVYCLIGYGQYSSIAVFSNIEKKGGR